MKLEQTGISDSKWIPISELLKVENKDLRDPVVIKQITEAVISRRFYPTTIFKEQINTFPSSIA